MFNNTIKLSIASWTGSPHKMLSLLKTVPKFRRKLILFMLNSANRDTQLPSKEGRWVKKKRRSSWRTFFSNMAAGARFHE